MADELVEAMNRNARAGLYDKKHPIKKLRKRAERGDANARSAYLMRTGEDVDEIDEIEPPPSEEIDDLCST